MMMVELGPGLVTACNAAVQAEEKCGEPNLYKPSSPLPKTTPKSQAKNKKSKKGQRGLNTSWSLSDSSVKLSEDLSKLKEHTLTAC